MAGAIATEVTELRGVSLPYILGGKYFQPKSYDKNTGKLQAKCSVCGEVKNGQLHPISNFTSHLKVSQLNESIVIKLSYYYFVPRLCTKWSLMLTQRR